MQLTKATDIGLRVLMTLAQEPDTQTTVQVLSADLEVPRHHMAKVVQSLAKHGWISTRRGRTGGLVISDAGLMVNVGSVVSKLEGTLPVVDCFNPVCPLVTPGCKLQGLLAEAQREFMAVLAQRTIAELVAS
ncbi:MAG: Rrf2 family transcriptional regulator [Marmoricola sp.]|jgi:Rrf2 family nitric oxide-sensitive transcriptional repressor